MIEKERPRERPRERPKERPKERIDLLLAQRGMCPTREQAQRSVLAGEVWAGQNRLEKPGMRIPTDWPLELRSRAPRFVSRAGHKLEHALHTFGVRAQDRICLDIGASTGGFTDCLLKSGARRVFAVDVGHGQLDSKLRANPQVSVMEKTNARYLNPELLRAVHPEASEITLVCADTSFISLRLLVDPLLGVAPLARDWVLLFKPQFEVGREHVGRGGKVRCLEAVEMTLDAFDAYMAEKALLRTKARLRSPVVGKKSGNIEILLHYEKI